ncbi:hypothetical protein ACQPYA_09330 [Micromonospora sp. CA-263727]|uniref:hypothetical protein n=1 Tax=Micromonospora sp. CA-263727 TaxID=3239967 RepID=UPI003D9149B5
MTVQYSCIGQCGDQGVRMDDPFMLTAATTLVAWATTNLAESARSAVVDLTKILRHRFRHDRSSQETVEAALSKPDPDTARRLAVLLEREARRDPTFDNQFRTRLTHIQAIIAASPDHVTNTVSGDISGSMVQAHDIHGGISFGGSH